jgi:peptide/nickel transport system substrate-binding protein
MNKPLHFLAAIGAASLAISACAAPLTPVAPPAQAPVATQAEAPTPTPAPAQPQAPTGPKVLKIRLPSDPTTADPAFWIGTEEPIMLSVYEGLVSYKPGTWELVNTLAETITPSADGLTIDFKLKEGIQFHGGYGEVTADDVKFSFERIAGLTEPALDSPYKGDWTALDRVEVTGKYTGKIILKEPFAALWTTTLPYMSGVIVSRKAVTELGDQYATRPIGTGPYELAEWKQKDRYILKKFEQYGGANSDYAAPAEWDEIDMITVVEAGAAAVGLDAGDLDFAQIATSDIGRYEASDKLDVVKRDTIDYWWVGMNVQHPKLKDINVRQAIRYAVDVPAILEAAWDGKWARACTLVAPGQLGHWADAPCYERDLDKAKEYLAKAGVTNLELQIWVGTSEQEKTIGEIVQANLADIGVNVKVVAQDDATRADAPFGDKALTNMELIQVGFITSSDPSWSTVWFTCDQVKVWNWMEWCNEEYDRLHFEALKESAPEKRAEMYTEMQKLWDEAAHSVWLAYPTLYWAVRKDIEPSLMPHGRILAWNFRTK